MRPIILTCRQALKREHPARFQQQLPPIVPVGELAQHDQHHARFDASFRIATGGAEEEPAVCR